jgi:hypothetical protein
MAGLRADPNEDATADVAVSLTGMTRESVRPGSDRTLEEAVRRSMNDLERELEQEGREIGGSSWALPGFLT